MNRPLSFRMFLRAIRESPLRVNILMPLRSRSCNGIDHLIGNALTIVYCAVNVEKKQIQPSFTPQSLYSYYTLIE